MRIDLMAKFVALAAALLLLSVTGLDAQAVGQFYPELARVGRGCRFNDCRHRNEPDCAVIAAVNDGTIAVSRYISYLAILDEDLGLAE